MIIELRFNSTKDQWINGRSVQKKERMAMNEVRIDLTLSEL